MLLTLLLTGGVLLLIVMGNKLGASTAARNDTSYARQDEYFTPRLVAADQQLQALAARLGGRHERGVVEWRSFATPGALQGTTDLTADSVWGKGSVVRAVVHGYDVEVTYGVQPLDPHEKGGLAVWCVLLPRVTVKVTPSQRPLERFAVGWRADDEAQQGAGGRLLDAVVGATISPFVPSLLPMPPEVERARQPLTEMASSIWRGDDRVEVEGRPVPRAPHEIREFGQGDFNVESLVVTIERSIELVRAMERG